MLRWSLYLHRSLTHNCIRCVCALKEIIPDKELIGILVNLRLYSTSLSWLTEYSRNNEESMSVYWLLELGMTCGASAHEHHTLSMTSLISQLRTRTVSCCVLSNISQLRTGTVNCCVLLNIIQTRSDVAQKHMQWWLSVDYLLHFIVTLWLTVTLYNHSVTNYYTL